MSIAVSHETSNSACGVSRKGLRLVGLFRALWPTKTAVELACRTGTSQRMCEYILAERYSLSADALAALLRSDAGLAVLEQVMGAAKPAWWKRFKQQQQLGALRSAIERQRLELEELEKAAADR
jgi:hypothetical protein